MLFRSEQAILGAAMGAAMTGLRPIAEIMFSDFFAVCWDLIANEAETYRHGGHSRADPGKYRPAEEVSAWLARDPLPMYRARLLEAGVAVDAELDRIEADAARAVDAATEFAKAGARPGEHLLLKDVWADGGATWRN